MKTLAIMWRDLGPEERKKYIVLAEADKARYFSEMASYTGPMQVPNTRAKKSEDAPKRAISAFHSFSQSMRAEIKEKNPQIQNAEMAAMLAQLWREASEEVKRPHIERENREREKYQEEIVRWKEMEAFRLEMEREQRVFHEAMRISGASFDSMGMSPLQQHFVHCLFFFSTIIPFHIVIYFVILSYYRRLKYISLLFGSFCLFMIIPYLIITILLLSYYHTSSMSITLANN